MTESDVGRACDTLALETGWTVERYEQRRATHICEGLPDRRYWRRGRRVWVELKAPSGKLAREQSKMSRAQHGWLLAELDAGGLATVVDDRAQLLALFRTLARADYVALQDAARQCRQLIEVAALRGYRGERKGAA